MVYELKQKGVDGELIKEILEMPEAVPDEEEAIRRLAKKRFGTLEDVGGQEMRKFCASLGRKGYSFESVRRVLGEYLEVY